MPTGRAARTLFGGGRSYGVRQRMASSQHLVTGTRPVPDWWKPTSRDALNALVEEGLAHSPSLAAAQATLKAAREQLRAQIGENLFPSVDVGFAPSRQRALGIPILPQRDLPLQHLRREAQASYTLRFLRRVDLADRALARQVQQQAFQLEATRRALGRQYRLATINAASLKRQVAATEQLVALGEQRARQLTAR